MSSKIKLVLLSLSLLLILGFVRPTQAQITLNDVQDKIELQLLKDFETQSSADFFLWLNEQTNLSRLPQLADKTARGQFVLDSLQQTAVSTQTSLRNTLDSQNISYRPYYIANTILVQGATQEQLLALAARDDVAHVYANHSFQLPEPIRSKDQPESLLAVESNLTFINADDVWAMGVTGINTVMAGNDTGLAWDHPALIDNYRGWNGATADHNYNWWDATGSYPTVPNDGHGHGTHTTGTMVGDDGGDNQIGVASGAKTIHCKNMDDFGGGLDSWFLTCFEWDLAPWDLTGSNPNPSMAPDAINNSWGYWGGGNPIFQTAIANLQAAGILVEVSAGNEGPDCTTLRSPSDYGEVLTTGSVNHDSGSLPGDITWFSSRGPSLLSGEFIPDIMAPGENIRSSLPGGGYEYWSGTSMAGPHVTALIGLMWSANPGLRGLIPETTSIIAQTAVPLTDQTGSNCGGDYTTGPNHDWGYGTIDAFAAVNAAIAYGDPGILTGTVTDSGNSNPLESATVTAVLNPDLNWRRQTDANGLYSMLIFSGTYTVTGQLYGYYPETITDVTITSFTTTTLDIALDPAPFYEVSGTVTDANTGWPLYASIQIDGYPGDAVWTDPATGQYSISLAAGVDYVFRVTPWVSGYNTAVRPIAPLTGNQSEDFALQADSFACNAPGYQPQFVYFEDFESDDGGYTTEGITSWAWGSPSNGPGAAHSGSNVWATNPNGNYFDNENGYTQSPDIDLSAYAGETIIISWWQWLQTETFFDYAFVEVSKDGGANWNTVYGWIDGDVSLSWQKQLVILDPSYAVSNFRVRFGLSTDSSVIMPGFYVDDVGVGVAAPPPIIYSQDFEADDGSFVSAGTNSSWAWGIPTRGPNAAHSGNNVWATNLDDNYNNNEDSSITSPVIDLSGYVGQSVLLSWWHWMHTELSYDYIRVEVTSNGTDWDLVYGPASGVLGSEWQQVATILDQSYLTSDFQFRVTFQSDTSVTYPGYYLDDLELSIYTGEPPSIPCDAPTGGLVIGHVNDANTGDGVNGATVAGTVNNSTQSQATPLDTAVADGFYTLYSPAGTHNITASKARYGDDSQSVNVVAGTAVSQNFNLSAGLLSADPASLSVTLNMGDTANQSFTLDNIGGLDTEFELREKDYGYTPVFVSTMGQALGSSGSTAVSPTNYTAQLTASAATGSDDLVCIFKDFDPWGTTEVEIFLAANAIPYQVYGSSSFGSLDFDECKMMVISGDQPTSFYDAYALYQSEFEAYVDGGGFLNFFAADFGWNGGMLSAPLPGGIVWNASYADSNNIDDPAHPVVQNVPNPFSGTSASHGYFSNLPDDAHIIASEQGSGLPTIVEYTVGSGGVMALGQPLEIAHIWGWELGLIMENTLIYGYAFVPADVPWLTLSPITGTVSAAGSQLINVMYDASVPEVAQPGDYIAQIQVRDGTPYELDNINVVMTVNAPASWGKVSGTVTGLARCDASGAPLHKATLTIGTATLKTAVDGTYSYWFPNGSYPLDIAVNGYVAQSMNVTVNAGQTTTQDITLRPTVPCTDGVPTEIAATVNAGSMTTAVFNLNNLGAGDLTYTILESAFDSNAPTAALRTPAQAVGLYTVAAPTGPLSAQTLTLASANLGTPTSAWFGGSEVPDGGIIRYAHAQCDESPNDFYIISGVDGNTFGVTDNAWRYDSAANVWEELAPIPVAQEGPTAVCYQDRIYVMGGAGSNQFYIYDIAADSWSAGAPLPRGVWGAAAAAWSGQIYLVGGDDDFFIGGTSNEVNIYDIATDSWTGTGATMPVAVVTPGYVQAGPHLFVVGGWDDFSPEANVAATQRYDLNSDSWETGPALAQPRADLALAMTSEALYAIGGDETGNFFFEPTRTVERLALADWATGSWSDAIDQLPSALTAVNTGFCTAGFYPAQVWAVGGLNSNFGITSGNRFLGRPEESCFSIYEDVAWLSESPMSGTVAADSDGTVTVTFDATDLAVGSYTATLVITSNDGGAGQLHLLVTLTVTERVYQLFLPFVTKNG